MGLDGTGKSTQAQALQESDVAQRQGSVKIHHASTKVPVIREVKQRYHGAAIQLLKRWQVHVDLGNRDRQPSGGARGVARLISGYFLLGSVLKSVWYNLRYRGSMVILDRCLLDDIVKVRWRFGENSRLSGLLMRLASKPDVVIAFEGDPSVTYKRKKVRNCTYAEYLEKGEVLEGALQAAAENGWTVERVGIDGRNASEVHASVLPIVKEALRHASAQETRGE